MSFVLRKPVHKQPPPQNQTFYQTPIPRNSAEENTNGYTMVYKMCTQRSPNNFTGKLYEHYVALKEKMDITEALPRLQGQEGEFLLKELKRRWAHQKVLDIMFNRLFMYVNRYYVEHHNCPNLAEASACSRFPPFPPLAPPPPPSAPPCSPPLPPSIPPRQTRPRRQLQLQDQRL